MNKSPFVPVLAIAALLLAGCGSPDAPGRPAAGPSAETGSASQPASSASADPTNASASSNPAEATAPETARSPHPEPSAEPVIEASNPAEPATEASNPAELATEPATEPHTGDGSEEETAGSFVPPPPHAEYAPGVHADIVPLPTFDVVRVIRPPGSSWNVTGSGYVPGSEILISFGPARSDYVMIDGSAVADANGHFAFRISLAPDLEAGSYGILTVQTAGLSTEGIEASKRFASVEVIAP